MYDLETQGLLMCFFSSQVLYQHRFLHRGLWRYSGSKYGRAYILNVCHVRWNRCLRHLIVRGRNRRVTTTKVLAFFFPGGSCFFFPWFKLSTVGSARRRLSVSGSRAHAFSILFVISARAGVPASNIICVAFSSFVTLSL